MANHTSWYKKSAKMGKLTRAGFYRFYFFELFQNFYTYFIVHQTLVLTRGQNIQIQKVNHQVKFSSCCVLDWHIQIESRKFYFKKIGTYSSKFTTAIPCMVWLVCWYNMYALNYKCKSYNQVKLFLSFLGETALGETQFFCML